VFVELVAVGAVGTPVNPGDAIGAYLLDNNTPPSYIVLPTNIRFVKVASHTTYKFPIKEASLLTNILLLILAVLYLVVPVKVGEPIGAYLLI
jgi:hypothetical protein